MGFGTMRPTRRPIRPGIEGLEGRVVPATYHVTDVAQLQADLAAVNNSSEQNTIVMAPGLYNLSSELQIHNANLSIIGRNTTKDKGEIDIFGGIGSRMFDIQGGNVSLSGLVISGGGSVTQGGVIYSQNATLTIKNTFISGGVASQAGGGIFLQGGSLDLETSTVTNNGVFGGSNVTGGGGIAGANAAINIAHSTIVHNSVNSAVKGPTAAANAAGGGIYTEGGTLSLAQTTVADDEATATSDTSASAFGAGIASLNTTMTIRGTSIKNDVLTAISPQLNTLQGSAIAANGGSVTLKSASLLGNEPDSHREIYHRGATVVLTNTNVEGKTLRGSRTLSSQ